MQYLPAMSELATKKDFGIFSLLPKLRKAILAWGGGPLGYLRTLFLGTGVSFFAIYLGRGSKFPASSRPKSDPGNAL